MQDASKDAPKIFTHRVIALLNREELEFLDKLGRDSLFSCGHKLSYNQIIRGFIHYAMETGLTGTNAKDMEQLKVKMLKKLAIVIEQWHHEHNTQNREALEG